MNDTQITNATVPPGAVPGGHDEAYEALLRSVRIDDGPLFTTDAMGLFEIFLDELPPDLRQHHNCNACRRFVEKYGGLVHIRAGRRDSAVWIPGTILPPYQDAVSSLGKVVARARVTGVFLSPERVWGTPVTGPWRHISATPVAVPFRETKLKNAGQAMAEKLEEYGMLQRSLAEFPLGVCTVALKLLTDGQLARSEKCIGVARWLVELHEARDGAKGRAKENVTWLAVAKAPPGFCHVRAGMIGTLLEDIQAGLQFADIKRKFDLKMDPLAYMRPQAAPTAGNIAQGEKVIAEMGAAKSLERRFATLSDVLPGGIVWAAHPKAAEPERADSVFGHLKPKGVTPAPDISGAVIKMTWEKFARTVLPEALSVEYEVTPRGQNFAAIVTAQHADSPPIFQWDREDARNPCSVYLYHVGSAPGNWNLPVGIWGPPAWVPVPMVVLRPEMWDGNPAAHHGKGLLFVLKGCVDMRESGNAIFPETLRTEFHAVRATIEAYSRSAKLAGRDEANVCGILFGGATFDANRFRVRTKLGTSVYSLDRWD